MSNLRTAIRVNQFGMLLIVSALAWTAFGVYVKTKSVAALFGILALAVVVALVALLRAVGLSKRLRAQRPG